MKIVIILILQILLCKLSCPQPPSGFAKKVDQLVAPVAKTNNYSGSILISYKEEVLFSKSFGQRGIWVGLLEAILRP